MSILIVFKLIIYLSGFIVVGILDFVNVMILVLDNGGSYGGLGGGDIDNKVFYGNVLFFDDFGIVGGGSI